MPTITQKRIAELERQNITSADLDGLVHDVKSAEATTINNGGMERQLNFLIAHSFSLDGIAKRLQE